MSSGPTEHPRISIITPCFNSEATIADALRSVYEQAYENLQYIVIDGGSTDRTLTIVREWEAQFGGRLEWTSEPDNGIYHALNKGVRRADGELIGVINSDDWYEHGAFHDVARAYVKAGKPQHHVFYGQVQLYAPGATVSYRTIRRSNEDLFRGTMIPHATCFVAEAAYRDYGLYDESFAIAADLDLMLRFRAKGVGFTSIEQVIAHVREGGISTHRRYHALARLEQLRVKQRYGLVSPAGYALRMVQLQMRRMLRNLAQKHSA